MADREKQAEDEGTLLGSLRLISVAGCLAMVYIVGVSCPLVVQFYRSLGATEVHFGLLSGLPLVLLILQFVGAVTANRLKRRKPVFMVAVIMARLLFIPVALAPFLFPDMPREILLSGIVCAAALAGALMNFAIPLWNTWMAEMAPRRVLNSYWGSRQRWMYMTWTSAYVVVTAYCYVIARAEIPVSIAFPILAVPAVLVGVVDICLFLRVREPPNTVVRGRSVMSVLLDPFRHPEYRTFVAFACVRAAAMMFAAAFMQLYLLKEMGLSPWQLAIFWCVMGLGNAVSAKWWGRAADRHGQRPVLTTCTWFKPGIVLVYIFITPGSAMWVLPIAHCLDGMMNSGLIVAMNGYMMKVAPKENRSMFCAALTGLAGIAGGLAAIGAGHFLHALDGFTWQVGGRTWTNYHILFIASFWARLACAGLVHRVREARSASSVHVVSDVLGTWPLRLLRFPVGLQRPGPSEDVSQDADRR